MTTVNFATNRKKVGTGQFGFGASAVPFNRSHVCRLPPLDS